MPKGGGQGGHMPPQILADQKAPPAAAVRRITTCPPSFLDFGTCLSVDDTIFLIYFLILFCPGKLEKNSLKIAHNGPKSFFFMPTGMGG